MTSRFAVSAVLALVLPAGTPLYGQPQDSPPRERMEEPAPIRRSSESPDMREPMIIGEIRRSMIHLTRVRRQALRLKEEEHQIQSRPDRIHQSDEPDERLAEPIKRRRRITELETELNALRQAELVDRAHMMTDTLLERLTPRIEYARENGTSIQWVDNIHQRMLSINEANNLD